MILTKELAEQFTALGFKAREGALLSYSTRGWGSIVLSENYRVKVRGMRTKSVTDSRVMLYVEGAKWFFATQGTEYSGDLVVDLAGDWLKPVAAWVTEARILARAIDQKIIDDKVNSENRFALKKTQIAELSALLGFDVDTYSGKLNNTLGRTQPITDESGAVAGLEVVVRIQGAGLAEIAANVKRLSEFVASTNP